MVLFVAKGTFYFVDFGELKIFLSSLFGFADVKFDFVSQAAIFDHFWLWVVAILFCMPIREKACNLTTRFCKGNVALEQNIFTVARIVTAVVILVLSVALLVGATNNPFLYTRF